MKRYIFQVLALATSFLTGWFLIDFLTVHPVKMSLYLTLTLLGLVLLILWIYALKRKRCRWIAVLISVFGFLGGYIINAHIFLDREDPRFVPELTRQAGDEGKGHTAVVYFTHGEPETYDPIGWINQFREFDEQGIKFVPFVARPVFAYMLRNRYLIIGKSNHRQVHHEMFRSLEKTYRMEGDSTTQFYICFLDDEPRPDAAVIEALNDGADTIIVADVFLTISNHTAEGQHLIEELEVEEKLGIPIIYTEPLWSSEKLRSVFLEKVYAKIGDTPKDEAAIALVGHGQPDEWDVEWATETEQEMAFREEIMKLFVADGFRRENLGSAWMSFKEPKPSSLMADFVANGAKKIFYFSAAISADAMHSQIDVPRLIEEYDFPEGVETINLGAWNNHPTVIAAIHERIDETMDEL
ncbi:MAG: CbiX/SirB N-terminal domain-containing protein [Bacteroides sp.]|nr:CbiX/SirB N-terminal domain-containing protein [Bacteroides sp.]